MSRFQMDNCNAKNLTSLENQSSFKPDAASTSVMIYSQEAHFTWKINVEKITKLNMFRLHPILLI